ncbi:hypothetical protein AVEN_180644-1 [Araneus ventricosus]|uniref:Uncharacterized protein n=1 Tax=Araneus ventricosus TaxID=182803 RepID=A0A4Y2IDS8_ARAVE|nr:hypothetical protein AVEN_180644-1 [Araneus ventricosus]
MKCERAVLAPTNEIERQINENNKPQIEGGIREYLSVDTLVYNEEITSSPVAFLNSLGIGSFQVLTTIDGRMMATGRSDAVSVITFSARHLLKLYEFGQSGLQWAISS